MMGIKTPRECEGWVMLFLAGFKVYFAFGGRHGLLWSGIVNLILADASYATY
jgi:hypothetical protein